MDHPEIHTPPTVKGTRRDSPIFVPVVNHQPLALVRRGRAQRRKLLMAGAALVLLLLAAFTYAFVVENDREKSVRSQVQ